MGIRAAPKLQRNLPDRPSTDCLISAGILIDGLVTRLITCHHSMTLPVVIKGGRFGT